MLHRGMGPLPTLGPLSPINLPDVRPPRSPCDFKRSPNSAPDRPRVYFEDDATSQSSSMPSDVDSGSPTSSTQEQPPSWRAPVGLGGLLARRRSSCSSATSSPPMSPMRAITENAETLISSPTTPFLPLIPCSPPPPAEPPQRDASFSDQAGSERAPAAFNRPRRPSTPMFVGSPLYGHRQGRPMPGTLSDRAADPERRHSISVSPSRMRFCSSFEPAPPDQRRAGSPRPVPRPMIPGSL
mmetsp:Transcript_27969/g.73817  ORF Transcript_27969/g.73817 Transcript_27969/m.73817 type:complete len:240 (-) Transcript_27969:514-1233(-)